MIHAPHHNQFIADAESETIGAQLPINSIWEQGAYVCNWDGNLVRVPENFQAGFGSPFFNVVSKEPLFVTKISEDPYVSISQARKVAANLDVPVNF